MAKANGTVAAIIRDSLKNMKADGSVTFTGDQLMTIMTNAGIVANSILELQAEGPATNLVEDPAPVQEHATAALSQSARADVETAQALADGVNLPAADDLQRAIAAAAQVNRMARGPAAQPAALEPRQAPLTLQQRIALEQLGQEEQNQKEVITGQTGSAPAAAAKPVSAANQERNRQIQERIRRSLTEGQGQQAAATPPRAVPRVQPRQSPVATAVQTVMEPQPVEQAAVQQATVKPAVRAATVSPSARQAEVKAALAAAQEAAKIQRTDVPAEVTSVKPLGKVGPGPRADGYQPAVGSYRDVKTATRDVQPMDAEIPAEELIAGANATDAYDPIPGVNVNVPAPYHRLTDPEFSEFAKLFEVSAFTPDCKGFVGLGHENFPWHRNTELPKLDGPTLVQQHQGFYGFNPHNGGPNHVLIRLPRNFIIWNFNHTPGNCRIFYIGRSNLTGHWYTPEAMDKLELFTVAAELAEYRVMLAHKMAGTVYKKAGNSLL